MKPLKRLVIAGGKYVRNGETKTRWVNVGTLFQKDDGKLSILLDASVNLAAFATKDPGHETDVWVNCFELEQKPKTNPEPVREVIVDYVPF